MWPWGHIAVGYLLYSLGLRRRGRLPDSPEVFLLTFGTLLPDLVDKPLAWTLGVLDSARSLGHSALIALVAIGLLYWFVAPRIGRSKVTAFAVGYLPHPFADFPYNDVLAGEFATAAYFVWPLRSMPPIDPDRALIPYILAFDPGAFDYLQFGLVVLALVLWYLDGAPGWNRTSEAAEH